MLNQAQRRTRVCGPADMDRKARFRLTSSSHFRLVGAFRAVPTGQRAYVSAKGSTQRGNHRHVNPNDAAGSPFDGFIRRGVQHADIVSTTAYGQERVKKAPGVKGAALHRKPVFSAIMSPTRSPRCCARISRHPKRSSGSSCTAQHKRALCWEAPRMASVSGRQYGQAISGFCSRNNGLVTS